MTIQTKDNLATYHPQIQTTPARRSPEYCLGPVLVEQPRSVIINPRHWLVSEYMTINGSVCKVKEYLQYDSMEAGSVLRCPVYRGYVTKLINLVARSKKSI